MYEFLIVFVLLATTTMAQAANYQRSQLPASIYTQPQTLVRIAPGLRLNMYCTGEGSPTVLLEAGLGDDMLTWQDVQGQIGKFTRVCAYDRAGYGFSDPASHASDVNSVAENLQKLIQVAQIKTPIVLVGHSIGGEFAPLFAAEHRDEVAGMVLVEPAFADDETLLTVKLPADRRNLILTMDQTMIKVERACLAEAIARKNDETKNISDDCLDDPPNPDPALHQVLNRQFASVAWNSAVLSELVESTEPKLDSPSVDSREINGVHLDFGAMPLIVITAEDRQLGRTQNESFAIDAAWLAGHEALARDSKNGKSISASNSGHFVQNDQPAVVYDAIQNVVEDVRKAGVRD